jgi:hypothetical protein
MPATFFPFELSEKKICAEEEIARHNHIPTPPQLDLPIGYNISLARTS